MNCRVVFLRFIDFLLILFLFCSAFCSVVKYIFKISINLFSIYNTKKEASKRASKQTNKKHRHVPKVFQNHKITAKHSQDSRTRSNCRLINTSSCLKSHTIISGGRLIGSRLNSVSSHRHSLKGTIPTAIGPKDVFSTACSPNASACVVSWLVYLCLIVYVMCVYVSKHTIQYYLGQHFSHENKQDARNVVPFFFVILPSIPVNIMHIMILVLNCSCLNYSK